MTLISSIHLTEEPYFTLGFLFFTLNVVFIGFYQSIEQAKRATLWMMLRGVVFVIPCFICQRCWVRRDFGSLCRHRSF